MIYWQGEGKLTYDNDSKTYVGNFVSDLFNGWGALHNWWGKIRRRVERW